MNKQINVAGSSWEYKVRTAANLWFEYILSKGYPASDLYEPFCDYEYMKKIYVSNEEDCIFYASCYPEVVMTEMLDSFPEDEFPFFKPQVKITITDKFVSIEEI